MAIGITYHGFWDMNPRILKIHSESYKIKRKMQDEEMWYMGMYEQRGFMVAIENCLAGKKAKLKYFDKPIFQEIEESNKVLTEDEKKQQTEQLFLKLKVLQTNHDLSKGN